MGQRQRDRNSPGRLCRHVCILLILAEQQFLNADRFARTNCTHKHLFRRMEYQSFVSVIPVSPSLNVALIYFKLIKLCVNQSDSSRQVEFFLLMVQTVKNMLL